MEKNHIVDKPYVIIILSIIEVQNRSYLLRIKAYFLAICNRALSVTIDCINALPLNQNEDGTVAPHQNSFIIAMDRNFRNTWT